MYTGSVCVPFMERCASTTRQKQTQGFSWVNGAVVEPQVEQVVYGFQE